MKAVRIHQSLAVTTMLMIGTTGTAMAVTTGESVYMSACVACHSTDGAGVFPGVPDFTDVNRPLQGDEDVLLKRVIAGFQSPGSTVSMPPRAGNPELSDEELMMALRYMRQRFSK